MCQELTFSACLHLLYSSLPSAPNELPVCSAIFVKKKDSGTYSDTEFGWWGVSYTNARKERFQTAVPVCILRKNFQNSVTPAGMCFIANWTRWFPLVAGRDQLCC
jgi:hypothetical protein